MEIFKISEKKWNQAASTACLSTSFVQMHSRIYIPGKWSGFYWVIATEKNRKTLRSVQIKSWISRQWMSFITRDNPKLIGPGVAVGVFPAEKNFFRQKLLLFYHFLFVSVILLAKKSLPSSFFGKKVLAFLYILAKKSLHNLFRGKSPCPLLFTATPFFNKFCVVP